MIIGKRDGRMPFGRYAHIAGIPKAAIFAGPLRADNHICVFKGNRHGFIKRTVRAPKCVSTVIRTGIKYVGMISRRTITVIHHPGYMHAVAAIKEDARPIGLVGRSARTGIIPKKCFFVMGVSVAAQHYPDFSIGIISGNGAGHNAGRPAGIKFNPMAKGNEKHTV